MKISGLIRNNWKGKHHFAQFLDKAKNGDQKMPNPLEDCWKLQYLNYQQKILVEKVFNGFGISPVTIPSLDYSHQKFRHT